MQHITPCCKELSSRIRWTSCGIELVKPTHARKRIQHLLNHAKRSRNGIRNYATSSKYDNNGIVVGTVVNQSPETINPDELISHIHSLPSPESPLSHASSVVFLLSKGYATWLDSDDIFLRKAVEQLYGSSLKKSPQDNGIHDIDVLAAVVDRIPTLSNTPETEVEATTVADAVTNQSSVDRGVEGISFCASHQGLSLPDLWEPVPEDQGRQDYVGAKRHSIVSFLMKEKQTGPTNLHSSIDEPDTSVKLTIPLANTMFYNGRESTMVALRFTASKEHSELQLTSYLEPSKREVILRANEDAQEQQLWASSDGSAFSIPLVPLTEPREIKSGMGNIVRQIVGKNGDVGPASTELESAVASYFEETGVSPQTVAVWALVIPANLTGKDNVAPCSPGDHPSKLLWYGATLRRVLSGGGGWGQKAGLLSLDPDSDFNGEQASFPSLFDVDVEEKKDQEEVLGRIASPGDFLRFFIASDTAIPSTSDNVISGRMIELGTLPSSDDVVASYEPLETTSQSSNTKFTTFQGRFGALSEGGLAFTQTRFSKDVKSKIDVPFSRFSRRFYHRLIRPA